MHLGRLRGLMFSAMLAAFMSTVDTQLNRSASYYVNDVYKRFLRPNATERQCVRQSRLATIGFAALAIICACFLTSIGDAWVYLFNLQAGIGLVLMGRWFWWRINVWSEISAMIASLIATPVVRSIAKHPSLDWSSAFCILVTAGICTLVWFAVTYLTPPSRTEKLDAFYRRVRPPGYWGPVARRCPELHPEGLAVRTIFAWLAGVVALCAAMFTIGKLVVLEPLQAASAAVVCVGGAWLAYRLANTASLRTGRAA